MKILNCLSLVFLSLITPAEAFKSTTLEYYAENLHTLIIRKNDLSLEKIHECLDFIDEIEDQNLIAEQLKVESTFEPDLKQYYQGLINGDLTFVPHTKKYSLITEADPAFQTFAQQCKTIYVMYEGFGGSFQVSAKMLYERILEKYKKTILEMIENYKEGAEVEKESIKPVKSVSSENYPVKHKHANFHSLSDSQLIEIH